MAVVARRPHAGAVHAMDAPPVFLRDPLHRVTRRSADSSVPVTWTITWVPMTAIAPTTKPVTTSARTDQRALGLA